MSDLSHPYQQYCKYYKKNYMKNKASLSLLIGAIVVTTPYDDF